MPRKRGIKRPHAASGHGEGAARRAHPRPGRAHLGQVLLDDVVPHLGSVQLSVKASTDHGHDVIDTPHPVLVSQQIPGRKKDGSPGRRARGAETTAARERAARTLETRLARAKATSAAGPSCLFARGNLTSQRGRLRRGPFSTPLSF